MRKELVLVLFIAVSLFASNFECIIDYTCGMTNTGGKKDYDLKFGMNENATDALDKGFDIPAPPVMPEVCYTMFIGPAGDPPFNLFWTDIRGISDFAIWELNTIRNDGGGSMTFDMSTYPEEYTIWVGGVNPKVCHDGLIRVHPNDANMYIFAKKGDIPNKHAIYKDPELSGKATLTIYDSDNNELEKNELKLEKNSSLVLLDLKYTAKIVRYVLSAKDSETTGYIYCP